MLWAVLAPASTLTTGRGADAGAHGPRTTALSVCSTGTAPPQVSLRSQVPPHHHHHQTRRFWLSLVRHKLQRVAFDVDVETVLRTVWNHLLEPRHPLMDEPRF